MLPMSWVFSTKRIQAYPGFDSRRVTEDELHDIECGSITGHPEKADKDGASTPTNAATTQARPRAP